MPISASSGNPRGGQPVGDSYAFLHSDGVYRHAAENPEIVSATGSVVGSALSKDPSFTGTYAPLSGPYKTWSDLPEPFVIPHRGAGEFEAPENTLAAYRLGVAQGFGVIDGGDYRLLNDGVTLADMHDRNMQRTDYNGLGINYDTLGPSTWENVAINPSVWFGAVRWSATHRPPTAPEVFAQFGPQALLTPEPKEDGNAATGAALIALIVQFHLQNRVCMSSFSVSDLTAAITAGIPVTCLNISGAATPVSTYTASLDAAAVGTTKVRYVCLDSTQVADSTVTAFIAAGYKVTIFAPVRQFDKARFDALGVSGYWANDPVYFSGQTAKYRVTSAPWVKAGVWTPGIVGYTTLVDANRGAIVGPTNTTATGPGFYRWRHTAPSDSQTLMGPFCPLANAAGTYTLTIPIVWEGIPADVTRHADCAFALADDRKIQNVAGETYFNGYNMVLRANGQLQLFKVTAQSSVQVGTTATTTAIQLPVLSSGLTAGTPITSLPVNALASAVQTGHQFLIPDSGQVATASAPASASATSITINSLTPSVAVASGATLFQQATITIAVTPSGITVTRTDGTSGNTTTSDTAYRGAYFHLGMQGWVSGVRFSVGNLTVT